MQNFPSQIEIYTGDTLKAEGALREDGNGEFRLLCKMQTQKHRNANCIKCSVCVAEGDRQLRAEGGGEAGDSLGEVKSFASKFKAATAKSHF